MIDKTSDDNKIIYLSDEDKKILQEIGTYVKRQLSQLDSYKKTFSSERQVQVTLTGAKVSLQVSGTVVIGGMGGDIACWTDPPGICEPGPCPLVIGPGDIDPRPM